MLRAFNSFYAAGGMRANAFLPYGFGDAEDRRARVAIAAKRSVTPELLAEIRARNTNPKALENIEALSAPGTVAVVTGQQVGLFLGPLYTVHKAASAIVIARELQRETGVRCVPVFWLQTEDHDFAEIAPCYVPTSEGVRCLRLRDDEARARCSLANRTLGPEVTALLDELEELIGSGEVVDLLREHYRPGVAPGRAFAGVLSRMFAEDGLIVLDPRCPALAELAKPVLRAALSAAPRLEELLAERGRALEAEGFAQQIELRRGTSLVFFHQQDANGPRYRVDKTDGELMALLDRDPLRFSTSALLRPLVQDTLLPTAVYVGGPAEVSYFAQLGPLYGAFGMTPPLIAERAHFRLLTPRMVDLLARLGLTAPEVERPRDELLRGLTASNVADPPGVAWAAELEQKLDALKASDPSLARAAERTRVSVRRALERFGRRHQQVVLERDTVLSSRVTRLQSWLYPAGHLQERYLSFPAFAARTGLAAFREKLLAAVDPFHPAMRDVLL